MLLVVTSSSMAVARGAVGPSGQMVLCTGGGVVTVFVDADGEPTGPPHYCPDCALSLLMAVASPDVMPHHAESESRLQPVRAGLQSCELMLPACVARGPPVAV